MQSMLKKRKPTEQSSQVSQNFMHVLEIQQFLYFDLIGMILRMSKMSRMAFGIYKLPFFCCYYFFAVKCPGILTGRQ